MANLPPFDTQFYLLFDACSVIGQLAGCNSLYGLVKLDPYFFDKVSRDLSPIVFLTFMKIEVSHRSFS